MTLEEAKSLKYGDIIYSVCDKNADGTAVRFKVNGKPKIWKRSPDRVCVPLKHGLYNFGYMFEYDLKFYTLKEGEE
jgi:hypothetical protein